MSEIREVRVEYGRTVNLGNYESERLQVGLEATVGPDEDSGTVRDVLVAQARSTVARWLALLREERLGVRRREYRIAEAEDAEDDGPPEDQP